KRLWAACAPQQAIVEIAIDEPGQVKAWKTGQAGSYMFVVMPDEKKIYAANFDAGTITSIDHASGALRQLPFAGKPIGIDASPDGREVWISNLEKNTIAILDPKTDQILETISSEGNGPVRLKFSPDGKRVVVTQSHNDQAVVFDAASRKL